MWAGWVAALVIVTLGSTGAQIYQGCNISAVTDAGGGEYYAVVLTFNGTVSFSKNESGPFNVFTGPYDVAWPRVRSRFRVFTSRYPTLDILTSRETFAQKYPLPNPNVLNGNTLRLMVGVTLDAGEIVTVRYWQPPITPFVDLLVNGISVPSFECLATMPNVTRLVGQATTVDTLVFCPSAYCAPTTYRGVVFTFSRPVVRCNDSGPLTVDNFLSNVSLAQVCSGLTSTYDQRVWNCTGLLPGFESYAIQYDSDGNYYYYLAPFRPSGVCDREYGTQAVSDLRGCQLASLAPISTLYQFSWWWFGQEYLFNSTSRTLVAEYESCGSFVPVNQSQTTLFFHTGPEYGSQFSWFPYSLLRNYETSIDIDALSAALQNYRILAPSLGVDVRTQGSSFGAYQLIPSFVSRIVQSFDENGLYVTFLFKNERERFSSWSETGVTRVLIAETINATRNLLDTAVKLDRDSYFFPGWRFFRPDLWGYVDPGIDGPYFAAMYFYTQPVNVTTFDRDVLRILSVSFRSPGTLVVILNNKLPLREFQLRLLNYSCGAITGRSSDLSSSIVHITVEGGLCPGAYLYAHSNLTWTFQQWFSEDQNITVVNGNLRLFNATLFNRDLGYLLDTLDLEFTPAEELILSANVSLIDLQCDGQRADLVFLESPELGVARFNVSGCNPDVADPVVSLLSASAVTTATRGSQEETDFPVSAPWFPRLVNDFCTTGNLLILQFDYPVVPLETSPLVVTSDCLKAVPIVARGVTDSRIFLKLAAPDTCTISFGIVTDVPARVNVYGDWCQPFAQSLPVGVESVYLMGTERLIVKLNRTFASIAELDASITNPESYYVACPAPSLYQSRVSRLIDYSSDTLRFAVEGCTNQTDATFITTSSYSSQSYLPAIPTLQASVAETVSCVEQGSTVVSARVSGEWELVGGGVTLNSPCQVASVEAWDHDLVFEVSNVTEKEQCVLIANVSLLSVPGFYETIVFPLEACVYSNRLRPSGTFGGMNPDGQVFFVAVVTFGLSAGLVLALAFLYPVCCLSKPRPRGQ